MLEVQTSGRSARTGRLLWVFPFLLLALPAAAQTCDPGGDLQTTCTVSGVKARNMDSGSIDRGFKYLPPVGGVGG